MSSTDDGSISQEIVFLEALQRLLAGGDFTSTYKFAVLIGLIELSARYPAPSPELSHAFTTRQLAEQVIRLYWPQVRPFTPNSKGAPRLLRQNQGGQAAIVSAIHRFQQSLLGERIPPTHLDGLSQAHPGAYERLVRSVEWKLIEMPLPRLQEISRQTHEFIYSIGWTKIDVEPYGGPLKKIVHAYQSGEQTAFDNRVLMKPGVVNTLRRLRSITRDLVEARWVLKVQQIDPELKKDFSLRDHLFGLDRRNLTPVRRSLVRLQGGSCFYCGKQTRTHEVDHFLPYSLSRIDFIENLVASCGPCNSAKSAHLPAEQHVVRWVDRIRPNGATLIELQRVSEEAGWVSGPCSSLRLARLLYGQHPLDAGLWRAGSETVPWAKLDLLAQFERAISDCVDESDS
jgi:5-methylcytosine-specific restriction endonuclease McrA